MKKHLQIKANLPRSGQILFHEGSSEGNQQTRLGKCNQI